MEETEVSSWIQHAASFYLAHVRIPPLPRIHDLYRLQIGLSVTTSTKVLEMLGEGIINEVVISLLRDMGRNSEEYNAIFSVLTSHLTWISVAVGVDLRREEVDPQISSPTHRAFADLLKAYFGAFVIGTRGSEQLAQWCYLTMYGLAEFCLCAYHLRQSVPRSDKKKRKVDGSNVAQSPQTAPSSHTIHVPDFAALPNFTDRHRSSPRHTFGPSEASTVLPLLFALPPAA